MKGVYFNDKRKKKELQDLCLKFRNDLIDILYSIQTGHPEVLYLVQKLLQLFILTR